MQAYIPYTLDSKPSVGEKKKIVTKMNKKIAKKTSKAKSKNCTKNNSKKQKYAYSPDYKESVDTNFDRLYYSDEYKPTI